MYLEDKDEVLLSGRVALAVGGAPLELDMTIPQGKVKLRRMLPVFQQVSNTLTRLGEEGLEAQGQPISCKAGCGACCRQAVPIAETEAYAIRDLVEGMEDPKRSEIKRKFAEGAKHFHEIGWFDKAGKALAASMDEYVKAVDDYFREGIACPFLENESCSIHPYRPVACREYMVTSPAENCSNPDGEGVNTVEHFLQVSNSVIKMSATLSENGLPYVPLIRALEWAENHAEIQAEMSGQEWAGKFFQNLTQE